MRWAPPWHLAHIELSNGTYVSEEIAQSGLGVLVVFGGNDERYEEVRNASERAYLAKDGFFDPSGGCALAGAAGAAAAEHEEAL